MSETQPETGQELVPRSDLDDVARVGKWLALSEGGDGENARIASGMLRVYYARELQLGPLAASEMHVRKGKLYPSTRLLHALARRRGYDVALVDINDEGCTAAVVDRNGEQIGQTATFTMEQAERAKLVKPDSAWVTYPRRMLWSKAARHALIDAVPEIMLGIGTEDSEVVVAEAIELEEHDDDLEGVEFGEPPQPNLDTTAEYDAQQELEDTNGVGTHAD
jgi:hypothetical protein